MYASHFEIQNGVLTKCRMSVEENVTVTIPNGVTSIGKYAFVDCGLLQSITIPDSVTSIGKEAFWGCDELKCITNPDSVISIGDNFCGMHSLEKRNNTKRCYKHWKICLCRMQFVTKNRCKRG